MEFGLDHLRPASRIIPISTECEQVSVPTADLGTGDGTGKVAVSSLTSASSHNAALKLLLVKTVARLDRAIEAVGLDSKDAVESGAEVLQRGSRRQFNQLRFIIVGTESLE